MGKALQELFSGGWNDGIMDRWPGIPVVIGGALLEYNVFGFSDNFPSYMDDIHNDTSIGKPSRPAIAVAQSLKNGMNPFFGILSGFLLPRIGARACALISVVCSFCYLWLSATCAHSVGVLYLTYSILGSVSIGFCLPIVISTATCWFDKYRSIAMSLGVVGGGIGDVSISQALGYLLNKHGWRMTMRHVSVFSIAGLVGALMMRTRPGYEKDQLPAELTVHDNAGNIEATPETINTHPFTTKEIITVGCTTRSFITLFFGYFWFCWAFYATLVMVVPYAAAMSHGYYKGAKEIPIGKAATLFTWYGAAHATGALVSGLIGTHIEPKLVCCVGMFITAVASMFWALARTYTTMGICCLFMASCNACVLCTYPTVVGDRMFGPNIGAFQGLVCAAAITALASPPIVTAIAAVMNRCFTVSCICVGIWHLLGMVTLWFGVPNIETYHFYEQRQIDRGLKTLPLNEGNEETLLPSEKTERENEQFDNLYETAPDRS